MWMAYYDVSNEWQRLRLAYDLYGYVKLKNSLEPWQVDALEDGFNRIYEQKIGVHPDAASDPLPPIGKGCESDMYYMKAFASATLIHNAIKAISGQNCQFLAADILCVYDDSIGPHRDLLYEFDTPKALIFLSDCDSGRITVPETYAFRHLQGSFAVLPGSHLPCSRFNALASQLSDWPDPNDSARIDITPSFLLGDRKSNGDTLYPIFDYDNRYQGYSLIPFRRGDVVIFSTRSLHALLPTLSAHVSKLGSFVFVEDFAKATGQEFDFHKPIDLLSDQEFRYASLPYNSRINDLLMRDADLEQSLRETQKHPSCLKEQLAHNDTLFNSVFEPLTRIYRVCDSDSDNFSARRIKDGRESITGDFNRLERLHREDLRLYYNHLSKSDLKVPGPIAANTLAAIEQFRDQCISGAQCIPHRHDLASWGPTRASETPQLSTIILEFTMNFIPQTMQKIIRRLKTALQSINRLDQNCS
jgi:hypothetical protein